MVKKLTNTLTEFLPNFIIEHVGITSKNKDSITLDTPSKGGELKVYFDSADMKDAENRISNAVELRCFMKEKVEQCQSCANASIKE